jgi:hypothetical protein
MMSLNKPLKEILSKYFFQYWRINNHKFPTSLRETILKNVNNFLDCGDPKIGYTSFVCLKCKTIHRTPFSCKSRFCSSCGKVYAETWANNLSNNLIQCPHRHAVFSLPTGWIRKFFFLHRHLLKNLADASYLALKYSFKKLGISDIGVISTIHTFSRKIEWNPHIHCLVTFGGTTNDGKWKNIKNLPWQVLRKSWQKCVLDIIAKYAKENSSQPLKNLISKAYNHHKTGFYVNAESRVGNSKVIAKYIGRYLARPAIAEYRIIFFNEKIVKFWYQNPDSKKKLTITLSMKKFLGRILSHIPPKNFKMVRRFGLYSRRSKNKIPRKIKLFKTSSSWADRFFKAFGINPLICRKCSSSLHLLEIFHIKYGIIQYNEYSP